MKIELFIVGITLFLAYDTYHEGKYSSYLMSGKKYFRIATICFVGLSLLVFMRKHPNSSKEMFLNASNIVKYMPVDTNTRDMLTPIFDFTNMRNDMNNMNSMGNMNNLGMSPQKKRMLNSGYNVNSRSVSETKKKYVASQQNWKCAKCSCQLDATFEVDHKIDLQFGGSNHVSNLEALCRNCHGKKTMMHKLQ